MTIELEYHLKDTAIVSYTIPQTMSKNAKEINFLVKCGIFRLMTDDHPSRSELYKIRYDEHGGLQLNPYQKILKKRLNDLITDVKEYDDLYLHILIPPHKGNYFSFCVMISSLKVIIDPINRTAEKNLFSSYKSFKVNHSDLISLHLDEMKQSELQNLFRIACTENNNKDLVFNLSIDTLGVPPLLFAEYSVELGIHEIEIIQDIVNKNVRYYDIARIQLNDRYARAVGWDMNDRIISITEPKKIASFGNERVIKQALIVLQSFHLRHKIAYKDSIDPKTGNRDQTPEAILTSDQCYLIITSKANHWKEELKSFSTINKYQKDIPIHIHRLDSLGLDLIQLFHSNRNLLIKVLKAWTNIVNSSKSSMYEFQNLMELFDDIFKKNSQEQLNEFNLSLLLETDTYEDLDQPDLHNVLVSKYSAILGHQFFNYKEKFDIGTANMQRKLWKNEFITSGIHIIDISDNTQVEQLALQALFLAIQDVRLFDNLWTFHSFGDGLRHSYEKVQQMIQGFEINRVLLHFTHVSSMPYFLRGIELMFFDREFSTYSVLKTFDANKLMETTKNASLLVYEQADNTLLKTLDPQMVDILYDRNVLLKLSASDMFYEYDEHPAKELESSSVPIIENTNIEEETAVEIDFSENIISRPFVDEEDAIIEEYEEDNFIGPDLLYKIPVMASFRSIRQYQFHEIEYSSNLPKDIVEKQLQQLIAQNWIETTTVEKKDVYLPLGKGMSHIKELMDQIPELKDIQEKLFEQTYTELADDLAVEQTQIDENNVIDVLIALRLSYHKLTDYKERKEVMLSFCSTCKYISDSFGEYDNILLSFYYRSLGIFSAFLDAQILSKKVENLLIIKMSECINAISSTLNEKMTHDFTMEQYDASSDKVYVFDEQIKEDEREITKDLNIRDEIAKEITEEISYEVVTPVVKKAIEEIDNSISKANKSISPPKTRSLPNVSNIPGTSKKSPPLSQRQLTPSELKPIFFSPHLGSWYKYHRYDYDRTIIANPLHLTPDDIIFAFLVNSILTNSKKSFDIKKDKRSFMFLNQKQLEETVSRSPLPLKVNYDNLINSGIIEPRDVGYTIKDIRSILPPHNVAVDPMYKRMNLSEMIDLMDESAYNFIHSKMLQSYIYADYYDLELQPVVAICYTLLVDTSDTKEKIDNFAKFIPWVYSMLKLHMKKKRDFMRSNELDFIHDSFISELKKIRVDSTLDLLEYAGDNDTAIRLKFLLLRKFKKLKVENIDINKHVDGNTKVAEETAASEVSTEISDSPKRERIFFSPTLIQQIEQEGLENSNKSSGSAKKERKPKLTKKEEATARQKAKKLKKVVVDHPVTNDVSTEIPFEEQMINEINEICENSIKDASSISPTDLLISIFSNVIYPGIIDFQPEKSDLQLIERFNEVGELAGVSNTVEFSRSLGDMQERWESFEETRPRIIKSFARRIKDTASKFVYNELFRDLLNSKIKRQK